MIPVRTNLSLLSIFNSKSFFFVSFDYFEKLNYNNVHCYGVLYVYLLCILYVCIV
ncbi:hypothetical protein BY996DRAFT_7464440 [Phakopsora pachyrhizi]|nr:hypothetical protein BY996DRAFT_7464440 [Phakopsora pachyrhizi]